MTRQPSMSEALVSEALGTFLLVLIGGGAGVAAVIAGAPPGVGLLIAALAHGLALCIIVNIIGRISGGHVNPAVTLGLASIGRFAWGRVPALSARNSSARLSRRWRSSAYLATKR